MQEATAITIRSIEGDRDGWKDYAGRIVLQWRDYIEQGPYLLVSGTDDPDIASQREIDDWTPHEVESTDWSQRLHVFRVRSEDRLAAEGYGPEDIELALTGEDDELALDEVDVIGVTIQPEEPPCQADRRSELRDGHDWKSGQAYAHGGGVQYADTCRVCGIERHTDTWAQDPCDGSQGHVSTSYSDADGETMLRPGIVE